MAAPYLGDDCIRDEWRALLGSELGQPYMQSLIAFLDRERGQGKEIYPPEQRIFEALNMTQPAAVKVVVLGQDPYHGAGQAHGLSFSVPRGCPVPPSLANIFRELERDLGLAPPPHGELLAWAQQGVLLLNAVLTVEADCAGAHQGQGWEKFTDKIVELMSCDPDPKVFMLWGAHAQKKGRHINNQQHLVLQAPHPSPLSAYRGFLGCGHFSAANAFLTANERAPINWSLPIT